MPHPDSWVMEHKDKVKANPSVCAKCHDQSKCATCHSSAPSSHDKAFVKNHPAKAGSVALCNACHGKDSCNTCHGVKMPHAQGWMMDHKNGGASLAEGSVCFKCHERKYCNMCHQSE